MFQIAIPEFPGCYSNNFAITRSIKASSSLYAPMAAKTAIAVVIFQR